MIPPRSRIPPLNLNNPIVDPETGTPTPQFMRLWQQLFGNETGTAQEAQTALTDADAALAAAQALEARQIATGFGLSGGGDLSADRTLALGNPALADPNADRGLFWDDSAGRLDWLEYGSGLTLTGTTLTASGGGGGGGSTPVVRSSNQFSFNAASIIVTWPTGTVVNDVVVIFTNHGNAPIAPAGWVVLDLSNVGSNTLAATYAKVMTAADISAGSVTLTYSASFNGAAMAVTIQTPTQNAVRGVGAIRNNTGIANMPYRLVTARPIDLCLVYAGTRAASNITFPTGSTVLQTLNATNASAGLAVVPASVLGVDGVAASSVVGSGYYTSVVALIGP
jgi:trimeric autotransporter adhesin